MAPDARMIAYVTGDGEQGMRVFVRDLTEGQAVDFPLRRLVTDLVWMPDGSRLVVAGFDHDARGAWSVPRLGGDAQRLRTETTFDAAYVTISPDGSAVALTSMDRHGFQVITMDGQRQPPVTLTGFQWTRALEWTRDDRIALLTVDTSGAFIVWTVSPAGQDVRRVHVSVDPLDGLCSSPDGRALYTFRNRNDSAELVRLRTDTGSEVPADCRTGGLPGPHPTRPISASAGMTTRRTGRKVSRWTRRSDGFWMLDSRRGETWWPSVGTGTNGSGCG
ncbi:MAG: hypothetical protein ABIS06_15915 [Vicinamibacterales bacterium]